MTNGEIEAQVLAEIDVSDAVLNHEVARVASLTEEGDAARNATLLYGWSRVCLELSVTRARRIVWIYRFALAVSVALNVARGW